MSRRWVVWGLVAVLVWSPVARACGEVMHGDLERQAPSRR